MKTRSHLSEERLDIARAYIKECFTNTAKDSINSKEWRDYLRDGIAKEFCHYDSERLRRIYKSSEYRKMATRYLREALKERFPVRMALRSLRMRLRFYALRFKAFF